MSIFDRLFRKSSTPPPTPSPSPDVAKAPPANATAKPLSASELSAIEEIRESGKWRRALGELQKLDRARIESSAIALALWIELKFDLAEGGPALEPSLRAMLALPLTEEERTRALTAYTRFQPDSREKLAPLIEELAATLPPAEAELFLRGVPISRWPADRLFAVLRETSVASRYDELLFAIRARFDGDPRLVGIKPRPLDAAEQRAAAAKAAQEAKDGKAKKRKKLEEDGRAKFRRDEKLEAAIFADPDDDARWLVYGDWLQSQGDPRGELISLQAARIEKPDDKKLAKAEAKLMDELAPALLGSHLASLSPADLTVEWRYGFMRHARVAAEDSTGDVLELLEPLLALDCARLLRSLTIGVARTDDENDYEAVLEFLAMKAPELPLLRELFLGDFESEQSEISYTTVGDVSPLYAAYPRLERLKLRGGDMNLGTIVLPELVSFAIESGNLTLPPIQSVCAATWPKLESLSIWFGDPGYGAEGGAADLEAIFEGKNLPKLKHLGLMNAPFTDDLIEPLANSPLLKRLESLDLAMGAFSDAGASLLVTHRAAFAHLKTLDVSDNGLSPEAEESVKSIAAKVDTSNQDPGRAADGARYVAVGE